MVELSESAVELLRSAVSLHVQEWTKLASHDKPAAAELKRFLQSAAVLKHPIWMKTFESLPPRGVVARMARRLKVEVHDTIGFFNYKTKNHFKEEISRIRKWYKVGRREVLSATGKKRRILRSAAARRKARRRAPARSIMNAKVCLHYDRLVKPARLQGLWLWRTAALSMLAAGLPMQTGTVPVERLWSQIQHIFPKETRSMSYAWFQLLANLAFLRVNYHHYNGRAYPGWCERDSVLKQSLDALLQVATTLSEVGL